MMKISKFLARHLRHAPEDIGLSLQPGGWVAVVALLEGCKRAGVALTRSELELIVTMSDKKRFAFNEAGDQIRANQGHSVTVDLQLIPTEPPEVFYHGTPRSAIGAILREGLKKQKRHHVHLSPDVATATKVGQRRGKPAILKVDAAAMHRNGVEFFCSDNGVWLVDFVAPEYLSEL